MRAFIYGPPSVTLTHSLAPLPQEPLPEISIFLPIMDTLLRRSGTYPVSTMGE